LTQALAQVGHTSPVVVEHAHSTAQHRITHGWSSTWRPCGSVSVRHSITAHSHKTRDRPTNNFLSTSPLHRHGEAEPRRNVCRARRRGKGYDPLPLQFLSCDNPPAVAPQPPARLWNALNCVTSDEWNVMTMMQCSANFFSRVESAACSCASPACRAPDVTLSGACKHCVSACAARDSCRPHRALLDSVVRTFEDDERLAWILIQARNRVLHK
jgi:hypothetical protein